MITSLFWLMAVVVNFPLVEENEVALVAWTTTPWTLPSNLALCVNPDMDYVRVKGKVRLVVNVRMCGMVLTGHKVWYSWVTLTVT